MPVNSKGQAKKWGKSLQFCLVLMVGSTRRRPSNQGNFSLKRYMQFQSPPLHDKSLTKSYTALTTFPSG
jgi:hypothetical protein